MAIFVDVLPETELWESGPLNMDTCLKSTVGKILKCTIKFPQFKRESLN